jgi:hypothetical protein
MLGNLLKLIDAIGRFSADMTARDPEVFTSGQTDIRYVVERQLYFALIANRELYDYFVACETQQPLPDTNDLSIWARQIAPYFRGVVPDSHEPLLGKLWRFWSNRVLRHLHRLYGHASVRIEGCGAHQPKVLFLVIHPKFVRYLRPIAERLSVPYAFLTIEDAAMFDVLARQNLPRINIELTPKSLAMTGSKVYILFQRFKPGLFDSWIIRSNAVRRAFDGLKPDCIVVPEGNAPIYELVNQSAKAVKVPTICVQQGWSPIVHPGFRNMNYSGMCVWGPRFVELLASYNPQQRFVVTGNHVIACQLQGDVSERKAIAFFLQNGAPWMTEAVWGAMLDFIVWAAEAFPDYEIRVRDHPGEPLLPADIARMTAAINVRMTSPDTVSLRDALSGCRVAVAMTSTTILEAAASGVVSLILDVNGFGPYNPNLASEGAAIEVTNFSDACVALERLASDDGFCRSFATSLDLARQSLFARDSEHALEAIVDEIRGAGGL